MIFISAGHHLKDSGAIGSGTQENLETIKFRDLVVSNLRGRGLKVITDDDNETLPQYLSRIQPGEASVVCEYHFDAANGTAFGSTAIIGVDADKNDKAAANELVNVTATTIGTKNRGVISEAESHRGRLGLMRKKGIVVLVEICFIDNPKDFSKYELVKNDLAIKHADILEKYDNLIL
jgi:N-acetylmuramoyl-L-alanine amidase